MKKRILITLLAAVMAFSVFSLQGFAKSYIGKEKAKQIALKNAGKKESEVKKLSVKLDRDDEEYEVKFRTSKYKYEYDITAVKGRIHEKEIKLIKWKKSTGAELIGKKKAISIALKNAKVSRKEARHLECDLEKERGTRLYEVEFGKGTKEYEYKIDAERKTILEKSIENKKHR